MWSRRSLTRFARFAIGFFLHPTGYGDVWTYDNPRVGCAKAGKRRNDRVLLQQEDLVSIVTFRQRLLDGDILRTRQVLFGFERTSARKMHRT